VLRSRAAQLTRSATAHVGTIEIDEGSARRPHHAAPGDRVVIRLAESPTSGYRWQLDEYNSAVLRPAGDEFVPAADARTGGGGTREFRFVVVGTEGSDVVLSLRRGWETDAPAAQHFRTEIY
jgi:inhibitor of cysteine peptidase